VHPALKLPDPEVSPETPEQLRERSAQLVQALRAQAPGATAELFDRYGRHVRAIVLHILGPRHEVTDIVHDVFVTALQDIARLNDPFVMRAWLSSIAVFQSKSFLRRQRRSRLLALLGDTRLTLPPSPATPEVSAALRAAYDLLDQLPPDERIPFVLRRVQGLQMEDVAEYCGVSLATAKRRLSRASERFGQLARSRPILREWLGEGDAWR
jgi:RNA polymerase sigma-70 factor (ECF subfamily)